MAHWRYYFRDDFAIAQTLLFAFSARICDAIKHRIDGLFLFILRTLLGVMMVYKYWDSIMVRRVCTSRPHIRSHSWFAISGRIPNSPIAPKRPYGRSRTCFWPDKTRNLQRMLQAITAVHQAARGWYKRKAALPAEGIRWTWLPAIVRKVLTDRARVGHVDLTFLFSLVAFVLVNIIPPHKFTNNYS